MVPFVQYNLALLTTSSIKEKTIREQKNFLISTGLDNTFFASENIY